MITGAECTVIINPDQHLPENQPDTEDEHIKGRYAQTDQKWMRLEKFTKCVPRRKCSYINYSISHWKWPLPKQQKAFGDLGEDIEKCGQKMKGSSQTTRSQQWEIEFRAWIMCKAVGPRRKRALEASMFVEAVLLFKAARTKIPRDFSYSYLATKNSLGTVGTGSCCCQRQRKSLAHPGGPIRNWRKKSRGGRGRKKTRNKNQHQEETFSPGVKTLN